MGAGHRCGAFRQVRVGQESRCAGGDREPAASEKAQCAGGQPGTQTGLEVRRVSSTGLALAGTHSDSAAWGNETLGRTENREKGWTRPRDTGGDRRPAPGPPGRNKLHTGNDSALPRCICRLGP